MKKLAFGLIVGLCFAGLACQPAGQSAQNGGTAGSGSSDSQTHATGDATTGQAAASIKDIPASLQNDAFHSYGLNYPNPITYVVTVSENGVSRPTQIGTQQVKYKGMDNGVPKFDVVRTGVLEALGSEDVHLDDKGVTIDSISKGKLTGAPLDMPAQLTPGKTWTEDFTLDIPPPDGQGLEKDHAVYKIIGPQQIKTKAGAYDTVLIQENDTVADSTGKNTQSATSKFWYAKDRGVVKLSIENHSGSVVQNIAWEAAPGAS